MSHLIHCRVGEKCTFNVASNVANVPVDLKSAPPEHDALLSRRYFSSKRQRDDDSFGQDDTNPMFAYTPASKRPCTRNEVSTGQGDAFFDNPCVGMLGGTMREWTINKNERAIDNDHFHKISL